MTVRFRETSTIYTPTRGYDVEDLVSGTHTPHVGEVVQESGSVIWDQPDGSKTANKPVTHCQVLVEPQYWNHYDYSDTSNAPNPRTRYNGRFRVPGGFPALPTTVEEAEYYIGVHGNSVDDLQKCIFDAYNRFVTGITALSASVSLAEIGETPGLFSIWQRRLTAPRNLVNGFLNYSFGWKPVVSDVNAILKEMRSFPSTVRKRLKAIGSGEVVRHYKFRLDNTIDDLDTVFVDGREIPDYPWSYAYRARVTQSKERVVVVTIRANVKPKLGPDAQAILDKLGALGAIPSFSTLWSITRLSFVVDWFYNIGGAIENLQGSLTHDISDVSVCISDSRLRVLRYEAEGGQHTATVTQKYYRRNPAEVPIFPVLSYPRRSMPYVLLGALGLSKTKLGGKLLDMGPKIGGDLTLSALKTKLLRDKKFRKKLFG